MPIEQLRLFARGHVSRRFTRAQISHDLPRGVECERECLYINITWM
jgi:hypothetical protein